MSHFPMGTLLRFYVTMTLLAPDGVLFNKGSMEEWTFIGTGLTGVGPFTGDFFLGLEKIHKLTVPRVYTFNRGSMEEWTSIGIKGFGPFTGDFFLGLEKIHRLTVPRVLHTHDKIQWEYVLCSIR